MILPIVIKQPNAFDYVGLFDNNRYRAPSKPVSKSIDESMSNSYYLVPENSSKPLIFMLASLSTFLYRIASWKTLLLAVILYVPFPAYILKTLEANMNVLAGQALGPIDLLFGYDPAKIQQMVAAYGAEGRAIYAQGELTADLAYPLIYTFLFCLILSLLFRSRPYAPFQLVNIMPVGILLFDLLENCCIVYLLKTYPTASDTVASLCSIFTNLKWAVSLLVVGLIVYGLVRLALPKRQSVLG